MPTTVVGILVAIVVAFGVMFAGGMDPIGIFFGDPMSAGLVIIGTIAATFASMAMSDSIGGLKAGIATMIKSPKADLSGTIASIVEFADKARKEGVLALDKMIPEIDDEFLARGVQLVVDGTDPAADKFSGGGSGRTSDALQTSPLLVLEDSGLGGRIRRSRCWGRARTRCRDPGSRRPPTRPHRSCRGPRPGAS